jgi:poly-beta-1,6-N-acetyl-D-glucosamine synthase
MDFSFPFLDWSPLSLVFILFLATSGVQLFYLLFIYLRFSFYFKKRNDDLNPKQVPVSIIIAARNEEDNLFKNLPDILNQDYPEFEVVVINHQSIDDSKHILYAFAERYSRLKVIDIERSRHLRNGKKLPLTVGIKGAKYEHMVFTDADCKPTSRNWLKQMAGKFTEEKELVIGYAPYEKTSGFLNFLIRFDTTQIAVNYFSYACAKIPYMGVGRNMAYTKSLFDKAHGFKSHYSLQSGDDDLFVRDVATRKNVAIQFHKDAHCYSSAKKTWKSWVEQKQRHYTTSPFYKVFHKLLLGIYPLSLLITLVTFVTLLFNEEYIIWSSIVFGGIFLLKWIIQSVNLFKLEAKSMIIWYPFMEILYTILLPFIYYSGDKNKQQWK